MHSRACHPAAGMGGMRGHMVPWPGGEAARSEEAYLNGWEETGVVVPLISRMADVGRPPLTTAAAQQDTTALSMDWPHVPGITELGLV